MSIKTHHHQQHQDSIHTDTLTNPRTRRAMLISIEFEAPAVIGRKYLTTRSIA